MKTGKRLKKITIRKVFNMDKIFTKEVRIALMAIAGIIVLFVGVNFLKGIIVFSNDNSYKVIMDDICGLSESSPIYADGYKVGVVRNIQYDYDGSQNGIIISIDVDKNMRIPKGSTAEVSSDLMGNVQMNLLLANNPRERYEPGDMIKGSKALGALDKVSELLPYVENIVPKLDSIMTSINILLRDPAIAAILHNAEATTANLEKSTQQLNQLLGKMDQKVPGILDKADRTLANTETLTGNLAQVDVQATMASINETLNNCKELTKKLNSTEGTIGKFLNDPSVYNNLNATMRDADSLMIDLKSHPKRYVHFSVFGRKDK